MTIAADCKTKKNILHTNATIKCYLQPVA